MRKILFTLTLITAAFGTQAQFNLDSLYSIWQDETQSDFIRVEAYTDYIRQGSSVYGSDSVFMLADELLAFGFDRKYQRALINAYRLQGNFYNNKGNNAKALDYYNQSLKIAKQIDDQYGIGCATHNIGIIYNSVGEFQRALDNFVESLRIEQQIGISPWDLANSYMQIGSTHLNLYNYSEALYYFNKCLIIREQIGDPAGIAGILGQIGWLYYDKHDYNQALEYYTKSLNIFEKNSLPIGTANLLVQIGDLYYEQDNYSKALDHCQRGYELSLKLDLLEIQKSGCRCLYRTYKALKNGTKALEYHELLNMVEDSLHKEETAKKLQQMEFAEQMLADSLKQEEEQLEVELSHQQEVARKEKSRNFFLGGGILLLILSIGLYTRMRYIRKTKAIIEKEKNRSEHLLLNILPADIAAELKEKGRADARDFDLVSILFTDFKGFTAASEKLSAQDLVSEINTCFEAFDGIMGKYGIEKIKTIGDAYMAAGGLPVPTDDSVKNTVLAALEMQGFIGKRKTEMDAAGKPAFEMRVGVHTGPVVAGIVGVKKFQYDIWGDTVNTASRMESSGAVGQVNISKSTYELLKDDPDFKFESRGKIEAKGKGEIEMYFVSKA